MMENPPSCTIPLIIVLTGICIQEISSYLPKGNKKYPGDNLFITFFILEGIPIVQTMYPPRLYDEYDDEYQQNWPKSPSVNDNFYRVMKRNTETQQDVCKQLFSRFG